VVELLSEMVASGATGRARFQGRGLDLDVHVIGRQGQGRRAGGLGGALGPGAGEGGGIGGGASNHFNVLVFPTRYLSYSVNQGL
jgi:hypothetical protein